MTCFDIFLSTVNTVTVKHASTLLNEDNSWIIIKCFPRRTRGLHNWWPYCESREKITVPSLCSDAHCQRLPSPAHQRTIPVSSRGLRTPANRRCPAGYFTVVAIVTVALRSDFLVIFVVLIFHISFAWDNENKIEWDRITGYLLTPCGLIYRYWWLTNL